jgi:hypothetical protein
LPAAKPVSIVTTSLPSGKVGVAYSATVKASGGAPPYDWKLFSSAPPGLALSSAGVWSGKPTKAGTYSVDVGVYDKTLTGTSKDFKITIDS